MQTEFPICEVTNNSVVIHNNQRSEYNIAWIFNENGEAINRYDVAVGDTLRVTQERITLLYPKLYDILSITECPMFSQFPVWSHVQFSHIRYLQPGQRNRSLAIGLSIVQVLLLTKSRSLLSTLKDNLNNDGAGYLLIANIETHLLPKDFSIYNQLKQLGNVLVEIECLSEELLMKFNQVESLYEILEINWVLWDASFNIIRQNHSGSELSVNMIQIGENWSLLYLRKEFGVYSSNNLEVKLSTSIGNRALIKTLELMKKKSELEQKYDIIFKIGSEMMVKRQKFDDFEEMLGILWNGDLQKCNEYYENLMQIHQNFHCCCCKKQQSRSIKPICGHGHCFPCFNEIVRHATGNYFVLNEDEERTVSPPACFKCQTPFSKQDLQLNIRDYSIYARKAQERIRFKCKCCEKQLEASEFISKCRDCCKYCQIFLIRQNYNECYWCKAQFTVEEKKALGLVKRNCEGCGNTYFYIQGFGERICNHSFCFKCLNTGANYFEKKWTCKLNCGSFRLTEEEFDRYLKFDCVKCNKKYPKFDDYYPTKACICYLCIECQLKENQNNCSICRTPMNGFTFILVEECKQQKTIRLRQCPVCMTKKDTELLIDLINCGHTVCEDCFMGNFKANLSSCETDKLSRCLECNEEIEQFQLENLLKKEPDYFDKLNRLKLKQNENLLECPKCHREFIPENSRNTRCPYDDCKALFCRMCNEDAHDNEDCAKRYLKKRILDLEQIYPKDSISQCPVCKLPVMKDNKCEHVKCPKCQIDFCFKCACLRSPSMEHGNHYHRPQCDFYVAKGNFQDKLEAKCSECTRLGQICAPPKNLKSKQRFDDDEY